jgi:hypothetical protein
MPVIKLGIPTGGSRRHWAPACAGATKSDFGLRETVSVLRETVIPAQAGIHARASLVRSKTTHSFSALNV